MDKTNRKIEVVFSERRDVWIEELEIKQTQSLKEAMERRGFQSFRVLNVNPLDPEAVTDRMVIRVRLA